MTQVRMKVARSELMSATPTLAKMAVSAAKIAESTAHSCQVENAVEFTGTRSSKCDRTVRLTVSGGQEAPALTTWLASARLHALGLEQGNDGWRGDELDQVTGGLPVRGLSGNGGGEHDVRLNLGGERPHQLGPRHRENVG